MWPRKKQKKAEPRLKRSVVDKRPIFAACATLENAGPSRGGRIDDEELDIIAGTTSGMGLRGKPNAGQREWVQR